MNSYMIHNTININRNTYNNDRYNRYLLTTNKGCKDSNSLEHFDMYYNIILLRNRQLFFGFLVPAVEGKSSWLHLVVTKDTKCDFHGFSNFHKPLENELSNIHVY